MKLLWVGDIMCATGFARLSEAVVDRAHEIGWDVRVVGINYRGDPHNKEAPWYRDYPIYPSMRGFGEDAFGVQRSAEIAKEFAPDAVVVVNDPWNMEPYREGIDDQYPLIGAFCIDGLNCRGRGLNGLAAAVFSTEFGLQTARRGGYTQPGYVIPYGVDIEAFQPVENRRETRLAGGLPARFADDFIFGTVARNHPRKNLDLLVRYFAKWKHDHDVEDARLLIHATPAANQGHDLDQLAEYYGLTGNSSLLLVRNADPVDGCDEKTLARIYGALDCYVTTAQGEGWGLPVAEAMAAGVPCICPEWAALGEWAAPAAHMVPCTAVTHTPGNVNVVGGIPDETAFIDALQHIYVSSTERQDMGKAGRELMEQPCFRWPNIADAFLQAIENTIQRPEGGEA